MKQNVLFLNNDGFEVKGMIGCFRLEQLQEVIIDLEQNGEVKIAIDNCSISEQNEIKLIWIIKNLSNDALKQITMNDIRKIGGVK